VLRAAAADGYGTGFHRTGRVEIALGAASRGKALSHVPVRARDAREDDRGAVGDDVQSATPGPVTARVEWGSRVHPPVDRGRDCRGGGGCGKGRRCHRDRRSRLPASWWRCIGGDILEALGERKAWHPVDAERTVALAKFHRPRGRA